MMTARMPKTRKALARKAAKQAFPLKSEGVPVSADPKIREEEVNTLARTELRREVSPDIVAELKPVMDSALAKCKAAVTKSDQYVILTAAEAVLLYRLVVETKS